MYNQIGRVPTTVTVQRWGDLPWMTIAPLITHIVVAIPTANTFLFQMATLVASINAHFGERIVSLKGKRRTCEA